MNPSICTSSERNAEMNTTVETPRKAPADFYIPETYSTNESLGYLLRRSVALMSQIVERRMGPDGFTRAQGLPLLMLYLGNASTVAQLARICEMDIGAMTRLLDRLEAKCLVRRERCPDDRRVVRLVLTDRGLELGTRFPVLLSAMLNESLAGFSMEEWHTLKSLMHRVLENLQTMQLADE